MGLPSLKEAKEMYKTAKGIEKDLKSQDKDWEDLVKTIFQIDNRTKLLVVKLSEMSNKVDTLLNFQK